LALIPAAILLLAGVDLNGKILFNHQKPLNVPHGERGLQQSVALFHHLKNLPLATAYIRESLPLWQPGSCVCQCTTQTGLRFIYACFPVFSSYWTGNFGFVSGSILPCQSSGKPYHGGFIQNKRTKFQMFLGFTLSGGTSELLYVKPISSGFEVELIGNP
jgi:N6-L-threonylcarbamoyladenine synthase